ncbi:Fc.00g111280.m01.CDS01 [Cosmosporella sp. VM-42]
MPFIKDHGRQYDVVVFGATGYTGKLTAEYITNYLPTDLKWAVAGRNESKLQAVVDECKKLNSDRVAPGIEIANLNGEDLAALAQKTCVFLTTVGPYSLHGEHAFKACAESGTHYVDATGEAVWTNKMIKKYEAAAKESGALLFPQSAIESAPPDLCTWLMAKAVRTELGLPLKDTIVSLHTLSSTPSGGTLASALSLLDVFSIKEVQDASSPYAQSPIPHKEPTRPKKTLIEKVLGVRTIPNLGLLTTSATGSTDIAVVERTWGLLSTTPSRKDQFYGPNFVYAEYFKARNHLHGVFIHLLLFFGTIVFAFVPPLRHFLKKRVAQPGEGAEREQSDKDALEYRGVATPDSDEPTGKQAYCRAWHHGGMYYLTGKFLGEIAATILQDDLDLPGGVYTPACLGQSLIDRLDKAGFHTEVKILDLSSSTLSVTAIFFPQRTLVRAWEEKERPIQTEMDSHTTASNASTNETSPLLPTTENRPKTKRSVTFSADPVTRTIEPERRPSRDSQENALGTVASAPSTILTSSSVGGPPILASLNNKLRRRNSHGGVPAVAQVAAGPKIGPQRSTKKTEKLKLLPNPDIGEEGEDEESGRDVYSQYTRIKDPTARRDAARLGKADRDRLPRVTAYCTANRYEMDGLMRFLKGRGKSRGSNPKLIDECIYTPYQYSKNVRGGLNPVDSYERRHSTGGEVADAQHQSDLIDLHSNGQDSEFSNGRSENTNSHTDGPTELLTSADLLGPNVGDRRDPIDANPDFDTQVHTPEVFLFDYGVVVIWGMSESQEAKFLKEISKFETEKLAPDDVEVELFNFYYTREYQARIYNDFITLRDKNNYMTKLAISHALAQSVKTSLFEELIASTIDTCKDIPTQIALTGKIALSRNQINMQIGELFILRINIHLNGSVLDTPELFWVEPQLEPVYQAVRSYLEMDQRVGLLTERLDVIADLLAVLKGELSHGHGEMLEWIVIVLIAAEILVAAINIVVDLYAGD